MQSTRSASMMFFRISPSPDWFDDIEPLARTKPAMPVGREMINDVLHPGEVGVADGRLAELPAFVVAQAVAAPVGDVERRVGEDEVGFEIGMAVVVKRVAVGDLAVDAAQREIHFGQAPGGVIAFLAVDADVALELFRHCRCRSCARG